MERSKLRSSYWFGRRGKDGFIYRAWMKNQGIPGDMFEGKPVIGICNTWSELTPCNAHFRDLAEAVKKGVLEAGGFPVEFPVMSLGETLVKPTAMLFRNLVIGWSGFAMWLRQNDAVAGDGRLQCEFTHVGYLGRAHA
jgi:L-arabonate dehydrase